MKKSLLSAALALLSTTAFAQYITEAPAGGFDFTKGKDYIVLYAPEAQMAAMSGKITTDMNLDPDMEKNQFYYWTYEWDAKQLTLYDIEDTQANSWGGKVYGKILRGSYIEDNIHACRGISGHIRSCIGTVCGAGEYLCDRGLRLSVYSAAVAFQKARHERYGLPD